MIIHNLDNRVSLQNTTSSHRHLYSSNLPCFLYSSHTGLHIPQRCQAFPPAVSSMGILSLVPQIEIRLLLLVIWFSAQTCDFPLYIPTLLLLSWIHQEYLIRPFNSVQRLWEASDSRAPLLTHTLILTSTMSPGGPEMVPILCLLPRICIKWCPLTL